MPLVTYIYRGDRARHYPYPPIRRRLRPGDEIDLDPDEVPKDIPLEPKPPAEAGAGEQAETPPRAAGRRGRTARSTQKEG